MPKDTQPVFSIIVRRFQKEVAKDIEATLGSLQKAAAEQPGYLGEQNSYSHGSDDCELVTIFAFDCKANLERWENSKIRNELVAKLDLVPQQSTKHTEFKDLAPLLYPKSETRKIEIVIILIFWILVVGAVLGYFADVLLPVAIPPIWRHVLLVSLNVFLISYIFLPWSNSVLSRVKDKLFGKT